MFSRKKVTPAGAQTARANKMLELFFGESCGNPFLGRLTILDELPAEAAFDAEVPIGHIMVHGRGDADDRVVLDT